MLQEEDNSQWLKSEIFAGGLHLVHNVDEVVEKAEESLQTAGAGNCSSSMNSKRQLLREHSTQLQEPDLLVELFQTKSTNPTAVAFLRYVTKYMQLHNMALPVQFAPDHPVEEAGRFVYIVNTVFPLL